MSAVCLSRLGFVTCLSLSVSFVGLVGCSDDTAASSSNPPPEDPCEHECTAEADIPQPHSALVEASGLVSSAIHDDVFYAHNDAGDDARFFAFDASGAALGTYELTNGTALDWEDVARGPCADPEKSCLYFADMGDNDLERKSYILYRVEEPATLEPGKHDVTAQALTFKYPDASHNAEALLIHPETGRIYVVTKNEAQTRVYAFPEELDAAAPMTLEYLGAANVPGSEALITGGDIHPDGSTILLRTKEHLFEYALDGAVEDALAAKPCGLPLANEEQGESVTWTKSGDAYVTLSEGKNQSLHVFSCP